MEKVFLVPKNLIGNMINDFANMIVVFVEDKAFDKVVFDFSEVSTIVTESLNELSKLFKVIAMLGMKVEIRDVPPHLAFPLSSYITTLPNLMYSQSSTDEGYDLETEMYLNLLAEEEDDENRLIEMITEVITEDLESQKILGHMRDLDES